jgi:hypothetical protein
MDADLYHRGEVPNLHAVLEAQRLGEALEEVGLVGAGHGHAPDADRQVHVGVHGVKAAHAAPKHLDARVSPDKALDDPAQGLAIRMSSEGILVGLLHAQGFQSALRSSIKTLVLSLNDPKVPYSTYQ